MVRGLLILVLLAGFNTGCFVIEELDSGLKILEDHAPLAEREEESDTKAAAAPAKADKDFWKNSRTIAPGSGGGADVVSCKIRGQLQFMKRTDCVNRGGQPK